MDGRAHHDLSPIGSGLEGIEGEPHVPPAEHHLSPRSTGRHSARTTWPRGWCESSGKATKQLAITEWDYLADGGGVMQVAEYVNATINGAPAVLIAEQDSGGRALWTLTWTVNGKNFIVNIFEPRFEKSTQALALSVTTSISK